MMRLWRRLSIRWRITIGSVLVGAVLLTAAGMLFRQQVEQAQINSDKKLLYGATTPYFAQIRDHPAQIDEPRGEARLVVLDPAGEAVVSNLPAPVDQHLDALAHLDAGSHFRTIDGRDYLLVARIVDTPDGGWRIVGARDQTATTEVVLQNLTDILIGGGVVLLVGFGAAAWLLTSAALRPMDAMRRRAETLDAVGSDELLPIGPARDEVAALGETLNGLLGRVRASAAREHQMVADASHELRSPLAVLRAQLELAQRSDDPAQRQADLADAAQSAERLSRLAENLLVLSRLEAEQAPTRAAWSELMQAYLESSDRMRAVGGVGARVEYRVDDDVAPGVFAIAPDDFGRLVDNLVGNAVKAAGPGGTVRASLESTSSGLRLTVADDGPGMPPAFLPVALDRFTTADESRTRTGAGLGLAIVQTIVRRAGGGIELANTAPGLRVVVTAPAEDAAQRRAR
jgi:signal transduction histidine kinase